MFVIVHRAIGGLGVGGERIIETLPARPEAELYLGAYAASMDAMPDLKVIQQTDTEFYLVHKRGGPQPRAYITIEEIA